MTPQQAGVSAERVLRTCLHCKKAPVQLGRAYCDECFHELLNGDCAAPGCKHEKSALATAPPEQAARHNVSGASPVCLDCNKAGLRNCSHFDNCDGVWVYKPDQPQAVGADGPLSKEDLLALDGLQKTHPNLWRYIRECGQAVLELQQRLAAHDQKVRADALQEAIGLARLTPFRAHAADDIDFHSGCEQTRERIVDALRKLAAPAASKPEASKGEK